MSLLGAPKKIAVGVIIGVAVAIIALLANIMANERAEVSYQLQGASAIDTRFNPSLGVTLNEGNNGNIGVATIATISVINATITQISITSVAQYDLSNYCQNNGTVATISNLTAIKGSQLSKWATIYVTPNEGVKAFRVSASVELSGDWLHPRNTVMRTLPTDLVYNLTSTGVYELLG